MVRPITPEDLRLPCNFRVPSIAANDGDYYVLCKSACCGDIAPAMVVCRDSRWVVVVIGGDVMGSEA